jgi:NADP-dependent aldehyde dehydrogenase
MLQKFNDATAIEIDNALEVAENASREYRKFSLKQRADFMRTIAEMLTNEEGELITTAMAETHLPKQRLESEKARTAFQLKNYADSCEKGDWMQISIDKEDNSRKPIKPDIRKMMVPLGPVVVFGASNFPFAYSTAGGDTACAFAAGCPVIVKAHPAHANTSQIVANIIVSAAQKCGMPKGIFQHIHGAGIETGMQLVQHPLTKAVGFTGSFSGGKQLFDLGNQRKVPIPVFAEMGSVNPVFLLPQKLKADNELIAEMYAGSITLSVGQFCTNPGLIIGIESEDLKNFVSMLGEKIRKILPAEMLHAGIARAYTENKQQALNQNGVKKISDSEIVANENEGLPTIATVSSQNFLQNPILHKEVFGPFSLIIQCKNEVDMLAVSNAMEGQLTATLMATTGDANKNPSLVESVKNICGRLIMNGVPTGVEVCRSMHHGGPYPATTDSRFTSVGADGIRRFARPLAFQNWPNELLPHELKDENPLKIWRMINSEMVAPKI